MVPRDSDRLGDQKDGETLHRNIPMHHVSDHLLIGSNIK